MDNKEKKYILKTLIFIAVFSVILFLKIRILEASEPETMVGPKGLDEIQRYLIVYIVTEIFYGLLFAVGIGVFVLGREFFPVDFYDENEHIKSRKQLFIAYIVTGIVAVAFISFSDSPNSVDFLCIRNNYSSFDFSKSISLLHDVNNDKKRNRTTEKTFSHVDAEKKEYSYRSGRSTHYKTEYVLTDENRKVLSQLSEKDNAVIGYTAYYMENKGHEINVEFYSSSNLVKSFMTLESTDLDDY